MQGASKINSNSALVNLIPFICCFSHVDVDYAGVEIHFFEGCARRCIDSLRVGKRVDVRGVHKRKFLLNDGIDLVAFGVSDCTVRLAQLQVVRNLDIVAQRM
jgi:hypothetical protein